MPRGVGAFEDALQDNPYAATSENISSHTISSIKRTMLKISMEPSAAENSACAHSSEERMQLVNFRINGSWEPEAPGHGKKRDKSITRSAQAPRPLWTLSHIGTTKAWVAIAENGTFHCDPASKAKLDVLEKR